MRHFEHTVVDFLLIIKQIRLKNVYLETYKYSLTKQCLYRQKVSEAIFQERNLNIARTVTINSTITCIS